MTLAEELALAEKTAVDAALELIECGWPTERIAVALKRPIDWVQDEVAREIAGHGVDKVLN